MDERELKEARDMATAYAREHARELAAELLEWSDTALLCDGRVRELARMLQVLDAAHALTLARSFAERAALELAARRTTPDREAIIAAARNVVRDALDDVVVHPCDVHNDDVKATRLAEPMLALYLALKTAPTSDKGGA